MRTIHAPKTRAQLRYRRHVRVRRKVSGTQNGRRSRGLRPVGQKIGSAEEVFVNRDGEQVVRQGTHWAPLDENGADTGAVRRDRR